DAGPRGGRERLDLRTQAGGTGLVGPRWHTGHSALPPGDDDAAVAVLGVPRLVGVLPHLLADEALEVPHLLYHLPDSHRLLPAAPYGDFWRMRAWVWRRGAADHPSESSGPSGERPTPGPLRQTDTELHEQGGTGRPRSQVRAVLSVLPREADVRPRP